MADQGNAAQRLGSGQPRMRTGGSGMATTGSVVPARTWARWVATAWFHALGLIKYALACAAALGGAVAAVWLGAWPLAVLAVPLFYAVEAQGVFLFPLALDGEVRAPFRVARRWTVRAGGTWRVMATVMPLAAVMLAGGFVGRGFVRSWCLGCLAVCLWYEQLRLAE